jgi:uncharacterized protein YciI
MHYILFYQVVEGFTERRTNFRGAHLKKVEEAHRAGHLVLGGALADPVDGAVLVFNGPGPQAAEDFAKSDPYVIENLVKSWTVRKWMTVVGEGSTPPVLSDSKDK